MPKLLSRGRAILRRMVARVNHYQTEFHQMVVRWICRQSLRKVRFIAVVQIIGMSLLLGGLLAEFIIISPTAIR